MSQSLVEFELFTGKGMALNIFENIKNFCTVDGRKNCRDALTSGKKGGNTVPEPVTQMRVILLTLVFLLSAPFRPVSAQKNILLSVPEVCAAPGETITFSVDMRNPVYIDGINFLLGLNLEKSTVLKTEFVRGGLCTIPCGLYEDSELGGIVYFCACFPVYGSMAGSDDPLFNAKIRMSENLICGDRLSIDFLNVNVSSDEPFDSVETRNGTIFVRQKGDANTDCRINVLDVVTTTRIISGSYEPDMCQMWAADINADGSMDVIDIVQTVNLILGKEPCSEHLFRKFAHGLWETVSGDTAVSSGHGFIDCSWYAIEAKSSPDTVFVTWEEGLTWPTKPGIMNCNGEIHIEIGGIVAILEILSDISCFATFYVHEGICVQVFEKILIKKSEDATVRCF